MIQTASALEFSRKLSTNPVAAEERERAVANPGFGNHFTDHMATVDYTGDAEGNGSWHDARIEPYGPISLDPAAAVLHYGQEIFEGMKAYKHADGTIWTFRADANAARLNRSAARMAMPQLPEEIFLDSLRELLSVDKAWVPTGDGASLYLRPFMIASEAFMGVRAAREFSYRVIASPAGNYFGGELEPVSIWLARNYARAGRGGTGNAKCGGDYAASLAAQMEAAAHGCKQALFLDPFNDDAIEELGGMNVFFVFKDGSLVTPAMNETILEGITRSSLIQLARDRGLSVHERKITLDEWREGISSGDITEVFACGTASVITPIGALVISDETIGAPNAAPGETTMALREQLLGIQSGTLEDNYGWMTRLA